MIFLGFPLHIFKIHCGFIKKQRLTWSIWLIAKAERLVVKGPLYMSDVMSLLAMEWAHEAAYCVLHLQAIYVRTTVFRFIHIFFAILCMSNLPRNLCIFIAYTQRIEETWIIHTGSDKCLWYIIQQKMSDDEVDVQQRVFNLKASQPI